MRTATREVLFDCVRRARQGVFERRDRQTQLYRFHQRALLGLKQQGLHKEPRGRGGCRRVGTSQGSTDRCDTDKQAGFTEFAQNCSCKPLAAGV